MKVAIVNKFQPALQPALLAVVLAVSVLTGCATQTAYQRPDVQVPAGWQQAASAPSESAPLSPWWKGLGDPVLSRLIDEALARNNNLAQAAIKVRRA